MISANCDIRETISALGEKDFFEMIYMLDQEATEAERQLFNPKSSSCERQVCGPEYVENIKNLIIYLRYGARPKALQKEHTRLLDAVCGRNGNSTAH